MSRSLESVSDSSARRRGVLVVYSIVLALTLCTVARSAGGSASSFAAGKSSAMSEGPAGRVAHYWVDRGKRIVFEAGASSGLWVMNADGQHKRKLAPSAAWASVSASGRLLARLVNPGGRRHGLIITTLEGRQVRMFTFRSSAAEEDTRPTWARDESAVAFEGGAFTGIYVAERGKGVRVIVRGRYLYSPAWSPDSRLIAFRRCPDEPPIEGCDLMVTRRDGSHTHLVARNNDQLQIIRWAQRATSR